MSGVLICTGKWASKKPCTYKQKFQDRCGHHKRKGAEQNQNPKCIGFLSNGEPCPHDKKIGDHCGKHAKKITKNSDNTTNEESEKIDPVTEEYNQKEDEEIEKDKEEEEVEEDDSDNEEDNSDKEELEDDSDIEEDDSDNEKLEDDSDKEEIEDETEEENFTKIKKIEYFFELGGAFKFGMEVVEDDFISEKISETEYTSESLEKEFEGRIVTKLDDFYITEKPILLKIKSSPLQRKYRYFIGLSFKNIPLIITPLFVKNDIIKQFCCILYKNFDLIRDVRTSYIGTYPSHDNKRVHETMYGKKAEKGGWYKVCLLYTSPRPRD